MQQRTLAHLSDVVISTVERNASAEEGRKMPDHLKGLSAEGDVPPLPAPLLALVLSTPIARVQSLGRAKVCHSFRLA